MNNCYAVTSKATKVKPMDSDKEESLIEVLQSLWGITPEEAVEQAHEIEKAHNESSSMTQENLPLPPPPEDEAQVSEIPDDSLLALARIVTGNEEPSRKALVELADAEAPQTIEDGLNFVRDTKKSRLSVIQTEDNCYKVAVEQSRGQGKRMEVIEAEFKLCQKDLDSLAENLDKFRTELEAKPVWFCDLCGKEEPCFINKEGTVGSDYFNQPETCPYSGGMKVAWKMTTSKVKVITQ